MADESKAPEMSGEYVSGDGWQWNAIVDGVPFVATLGDDRETITLEKASAGGTRITLHPFSLAPEKADETESVIRAFSVADQVAARRALEALRSSWRSDKPSPRRAGEAVNAIEFEDAQLAAEPAERVAKRQAVADFESMREAFERERARGRALFEALEQVTEAIDLPHTQPRLAANESNAGIDRFAETVALRVESIQGELEATRYAARTYRAALELAGGGLEPRRDLFDVSGHDRGDDVEADAERLRRRVDKRIEAAERVAKPLPSEPPGIESWRARHGQSPEAMRTRAAELWHVVETVIDVLRIPRTPELVDGASLGPLRERVRCSLRELLEQVEQRDRFRELAARHCPPSSPDESDDSLRRRLDAQLVEARQAAPWLRRLKQERAHWRELACEALGIAVDGDDAGDVLREKLSEHVRKLEGSCEAWRALAARTCAGEHPSEAHLRAELGRFCETAAKRTAQLATEREELRRKLDEVRRKLSHESRELPDEAEIRDVALDTLSGDSIAVNPPPFARGERIKLGGVRWKCVDVQWQPDPGGRAEWQRVAYCERLASREA